MERKDKILTQEEYSQIRAEITQLEMEQALKGVNHSERIKELKESIGAE